MNLALPTVASVLVIAAVSVVLPWSTCPIVPTLICGLVRSNFCLATLLLQYPANVSAGRCRLTLLA